LQFLQRIEVGKHNIGLRLLQSLAAALSVGVGELFRMPKNLKVRRGRPPGSTNDSGMLRSKSLRRARDH
jgi:hypothetical protein